jgi:hypothetical protein
MFNNITTLLGKTTVELEEIFGVPCPVTPENPLEGETTYVTLPQFGLALVIENERASCIQLFAPGSSAKYCGYQGEFFAGLTFDASRKNVRGLLGVPIKTEDGGEGKGLFGSYLKPWDIFMHCSHEYHFEYTRDGTGIHLVSISNARGQI